MRGIQKIVHKSAGLGRREEEIASVNQWHEQEVCEALLPSPLYVFPWL